MKRNLKPSSALKGPPKEEEDVDQRVSAGVKSFAQEGQASGQAGFRGFTNKESGESLLGASELVSKV